MSEHREQRTDKPWLEIREDHKGKLDEVVAQQVSSFHLEYMNEGEVWMGIHLADGRFVRVSLFTKGKAHIHGLAEIDKGTIETPQFFSAELYAARAALRRAYRKSEVLDEPGYVTVNYPPVKEGEPDFDTIKSAFEAGE